MYKKHSKKNDPQLRIESFFLPFGGQLRSSNQWVKLESLIPWDEFEEKYASQFPSKTGAPALPFRVALGALLVKERMNMSDRATVDYIAENPYVQYFLGYSSFLEEPPFDASSMTHFRKRISADMLAEINEHIVRQHLVKKEGSRKEDDSSDDSDDSGSSGTMIIDASCTPGDIRYPTDTSLLSEAREISEDVIDTLWKSEPRNDEKPRTYRQKARK